MIEHRDEYVGVPPDVRMALKRITHELNSLTVLDQESLLQMLVARHVLHKAFPDKEKALKTLAEICAGIIEITKISMEETRVRKNQS